MTTLDAAQVDPQYVIETLIEENKAITENRLYLMALIKQIQAEFVEAQTNWAKEKESLLKTTGD